MLPFSFSSKFLIGTIAIIAIFSAFNLITSTSSQAIGIGICPKPKPFPYLNVTRYSGKWYEIEKYFAFFEVTSKCTAVIYSPNFEVQILQKDMLTHKSIINNGITRFVSKDGSGDVALDLGIVQTGIPVTATFAYQIIDTDYKSYTVKYGCRQVGPITMEYIWILSRFKYLTPTSRAKAYGTLHKYGIDTTRLQPAIIGNCPW